MVKGPVEMKINQPQDLTGSSELDTSLSKAGGAVSVTGWGAKVIHVSWPKVIPGQKQQK